MKKIFNIILVVLFIGLISINIVKAKSGFSCDSEVEVGENIKCSVTVDSESVMIESDGNIKISNISGNSYAKKNTYQAVFYESGTIYFGPSSDTYSKYIISLKDENGVSAYAPDQRVNVIAKKVTTTTTKLRSNNNYLTYIKINGNLIEGYDKTIFKYDVEVANNVEKISIESEPEDNTAVISLNGPKSLEVGENEYTIKVVSEDETIRFYKVIVTRKDKISSNNKIKNIDILGYDLKFDGKSKTYYLKINNKDEKLDISVVLDDERASYVIEGNEDLKDGSTIKIIVTAENNETDTYKIIVNKDVLTNSKDKNKTPLIISCIVLIVVIVLVVIFIIKKRKRINTETKVKKEDKDNKKVDEDLEKTKTLHLDELKKLNEKEEDD